MEAEFTTSKREIKNIPHIELLEMSISCLDEQFGNFKMLIDISSYFCDILHLRKFEHKQKRITRSRYEFCQMNLNCLAFYEENLCVKDHYPYDKIRADILSVIKYPEDKEKSIKTLKYVLCHMKDELEGVMNK